MSSRKKIMITLIIILLPADCRSIWIWCILFHRAFLTGINGKRIQLFLYDSIPVRRIATQKVGAYVLTIDTRNNGQGKYHSKTGRDFPMTQMEVLIN